MADKVKEKVQEPDWSSFGPPKDTVYYERLKVNAYVKKSAIRTAYRKAAAVAHPDKGGSNEAFSELNEAHQVLSDIRKRVEYHVNGIRTGATPSEPGDVKGSQALFRACARVIANVIQEKSKTLSSMFDGFVRLGDFSNKDFVNLLRTDIAADLAQKRQKLTMYKAHHEDMTAIMGRLAFDQEKAGENQSDILGAYFKTELNKIEYGRKQAQEDLEELEHAQGLLAYYTFQWNNPAASGSATTESHWRAFNSIKDSFDENTNIFNVNFDPPQFKD